MKRDVKKIVLCRSRHSIPEATDGYIYPMTVDFSDLAEVDDRADRWACRLKLENSELHLYVTGVQYPLIAMVNACLRRKVPCTLFHFDPNTEKYYPQRIWQEGINEQT